jgi:hypothetical protein
MVPVLNTPFGNLALLLIVALLMIGPSAARSPLLNGQSVLQPVGVVSKKEEGVFLWSACPVIVAM